jgi:hypothetical protein
MSDGRHDKLNPVGGIQYCSGKGSEDSLRRNCQFLDQTVDHDDDTRQRRASVSLPNHMNDAFSRDALEVVMELTPNEEAIVE